MGTYCESLLEIPGEQLAAAVEKTCANLLYDAQVTNPPVDALALARRLGLVVARHRGAPYRARFVRLGANGQGTIFLGDQLRAERRQWAVAHEIGECCAHHVIALLGVQPDYLPAGARETVANRMASGLLLPHPWFLEHGRRAHWDLFDLKGTFRTASHELIARRMLEMPLPVVITLFDQEKMTWRRSNASQRTAPWTSAEEVVWQAARHQARVAQAEPGELPASVTNIRAWPVHEPPRRREIVRTDLCDDGF